jgi:glycosyltransferase involved in cell wall biosynthesis
MKRILIFNWRDTRHAEGGGAEIYIHEIARRWVQAGNRVTLFCGNDGKSVAEEDIDGVHIIRKGSFNLVYVWAFIYYQTRFRDKFDVIVDCENGIPFFTPLYSRLPVYCIVFHVHQDVFTQYLKPAPAMLARFLERRCMPLIYRRKHYITISESSQQSMVSRLGIKAKQIQLVYCGIDLIEFVPGIKNTKPTALYVGRLKAYKSVDVLIRAFKQVIIKLPNAQLLIAGTGDADQDLQTLTNALGLQKNVTFLGRVNETEKVRLMQDAWVFCNPSYAEGWGITTIEANACATPVIASDVDGLRDSVNQPSAGYLAPYGDVHSFADKITQILSDKPRLKVMSTNARDWAEKFDWQISADNFLKIIK